MKIPRNNMKLHTGRSITIISDVEARRIAAEWHSGGGSPLYSFASTGAVTLDTIREVDRNLREIGRIRDSTGGADLLNLVSYLRFVGERPEQPGWNNLVW
jgi:hypothetical protein